MQVSKDIIDWLRDDNDMLAEVVSHLRGYDLDPRDVLLDALTHSTQMSISTSPYDFEPLCFKHHVGLFHVLSNPVSNIFCRRPFREMVGKLE